MDNEAEKDLQCQAPVGLDLPPEKPLASSLAKQEGQNNSELTVLNEEAEIILGMIYLLSSLIISVQLIIFLFTFCGLFTNYECREINEHI